jgi:hypothetical protein
MNRLGLRLLTLLGVTALTAPAALAADSGEPLATRQSAFSVPFSLDAEESSPPKEVQLYVSPDKGGRWDLYDKVAPDRGSFVFRAPRDGEYWFAIRSVDAAGKATPDGAFSPGLKVIVDTMPPRLDVTAERLPTGELSAQWQSVDPLLDPSTIKIEYRSDDNDEWRELAASQARISEGRNTLSGDGVWWLQDAPGGVALRLQISDRAGNPTITQFKLKAPASMAQNGMQPVESARRDETGDNENVEAGNPSGDTALAGTSGRGYEEVPPPAAELPGPAVRSFGVSANAGPTAPSPRYWGGSQNGDSTTNNSADNRPSTAQRDTSVGRNPFARFRSPAADNADNDIPQLDRQPPRAADPANTAASDGDTRWPASGVASRPLGTGNRAETDWRVGASGSDQTPGFVHSNSSAGTDRGTVGQDGFRPAGTGGIPGASGTENNGGRPSMHTASLNPGRSAAGGNGGGTSSSRFDYGDLSPAERPKMVNTRTFEIDYEIESVGSSGIARVELFGTRDGGTTWVSLGTDPDNRSPLVVTVNGEGLYGFYVVVESASGLSGSPPRPGQRPELWIGVDLTKPQVAISGVEPGNNPDEMVVYWEAQDRRFNGRPISVFFSNRPGGPWTIAAGSLENTGSYVWRLDNRVREQVYLKVEARDAAGNVGWFETTEPIALNRQLPQGKIRGVRPVGGEGYDGQAARGRVIENQFAR